MRRAAAGSLEHLVPVEREKFSVVLRPPGKRVNPIEAENVIDAKEMKTLPHVSHALYRSARRVYVLIDRTQIDAPMFVK